LEIRHCIIETLISGYGSSLVKDAGRLSYFDHYFKFVKPSGLLGKIQKKKVVGVLTMKQWNKTKSWAGSFFIAVCLSCHSNFLFFAGIK